MSPGQAELDAILARIPYARFLGVRVELHGDEMTAVLPFSEHIIGNPSLPALHGGVIGAFMEMTAVLQLSIAEALRSQPKTVDVSIDYLRSGRPQDTYARALIKKAGRRIANVQVEAWQETRAAPIAALRGHFLLTPVDPLP
ncbi:MAG TPA: PaaI family thioesterase [Caulobacteraceae bacterium]|nr:PaaI family thioesterase [Caulobacteraceae bacterium]